MWKGKVVDKQKVKIVKEWRDKPGKYLYILKKRELVFISMYGGWFESCSTYDYKLVKKWQEHYGITIKDIEVDPVDSTNSSAPHCGGP